MKRYAIYDLKSGRILQTHVEAPASGITRHLSDQEVLDVLRADVERDTVGVAVFDKRPEPGMEYHVDMKTRQISMTPRRKTK